MLRIRKYFATENAGKINVSYENDDDKYLKLDKTAKLNSGHNFLSEMVVPPVVVNVKTEISRWYEMKWHGLPRRLLILSVENTIQFSYQYSTLLFNHVYPNLLDVNEDENIFYTITAVRTLSIFFSTLSLISPIMDRMTILAYIHGGAPSGISVTIKCLQIISHLVISTGVSLLCGLVIPVSFYFPCLFLIYNITIVSNYKLLIRIR